MKIKHKLLIFVLTFVIVFGIWFLYEGAVTGFSVAKVSSEIPQENSSEIQAYFCPRDNCGEKLSGLINSAQEVECAFYNLNLKSVKDALKSKNYKLIVDSDGEKYISEMDYIARPEGSGLMHNKFCIFDNATVLTGSFNPTNKQNTVDNNNIIIISSKYIAENYNSEFTELWSDRFAEGEPVRYSKIIYNSELIENYFCPEDYCTEHLIDVLKSAESEIKFLTFSFTDDSIGDLLLEKVKSGVSVSGAFDKAQAGSQYSEFRKLNGTADVRRDNSTGLLHHKVFIIDRKIVVTGSFNPTKNADTKNDENLLIIHSPAIAEKYLEEFELVWENETTTN